MVNNSCKVQINHLKLIFLKIKKILIRFKIEILMLKKNHQYIQEKVSCNKIINIFCIDVNGKVAIVNLLSNI
jgi:hypothetical protein